MWHDLEGSTPIDTSAAKSEPASPRPSATLPSAALPTTFTTHPTYTIGTRSHSFATEHLKPPPASPLVSSMPGSEETSVEATLSTPASPSSTPSSRNGLRLTSSHQRSKSSSSSSSSPTASEPSSGTTISPSLSRQSSLSLNLNRQSSLSKKHTKQQQQQQQDRDPAIPASPSSTHRPQKHVMLNRRSVSQDFQIRLQQQQQRQEDLGEELSEAGEDLGPGTPTSISSFGSGTMGMSGSEREKDRNLSGRSNRLSKSSVALIESRNIQTLSSNLAMVSSPTDSEFPQQNSDALLSTIAQKEARIAQLREDLEANLSELTQLKERWSQMMIEERNRQHAEATASIQEQNGHNGSQSVSHRLSSTGAGIWGTVVGSVSGISGASGGISLHNINAAHQHQQYQYSQSIGSPGGLVSGRSSTSSNPGRGEGHVTSGSSRPTSPLPAYLNNFSSLNGLNTPLSPVGQGGSLSPTLNKKGDRTSLSSLSTCSSSQSNAGDGPTSFEAGHSSQSSFSSSGQPDQNGLQVQLHKEHRESRRMKRESSGLFIPPEAEEVLVNTGRALFKGFGSLLGGIRTVVSDVAESDRFQHSRQRTIDMVSGLAQTAADALPLPSHDDIYYHHQRLRLLDEEEEEGSASAELRQQRQQNKEQRRRERQKEKERRFAGNENGESSSELSGVTRSPSLVRRTSRKAGASQEKAGKLESEESESVSHSRSVSQLLIRKESNPVAEEEALEWGIEDKELLESLEADVRGQKQGISTASKIDSEMGSPIDTLMRTAMEPSTTTLALASKKND
ncbi:hypothetical protein BGX27_009121 [Mortierella sp. AM989]|nr:hypothetical protein BGX27_009121 [Mortierella sp. AM989]